jgi:archaellum component FlaG (FlaF/FlaG flagellin family)
MISMLWTMILFIAVLLMTSPVVVLLTHFSERITRYV